jgi:lysozyme
VGGAQVQGIDVSSYQGTIDWTQVAGAGIGFAFIRVSDGTQAPDGDFAANWAGAKAAGVIRGAYQYIRASEDGATQADLLISGIGGQVLAGDLPPVADVETLDGETAAHLIACLQNWIAEVESKLGVTPIIYCGQGFWNTLGTNGAFWACDLWVANWQVSSPAIPSDWATWNFWQYNDTGSIPGMSSPPDVDVFNGTLADLQAYALGARPSNFYRGVAMDSTGQGLWTCSLDGGVFEYGDATFRGTAAGQTYSQPILGIVRTPTGFGYWVFGAAGNVAAFGDAVQEGDLSSQALAAPVCAMAATPTGKGYWLLQQNGAVTPFGDAKSHGSPSSAQLTDTAVAIASSPSGAGYFVALADGNVLGFGDATAVGTLAGTAIAAPIVAMAETVSGKGYWLLDSQGAVTSFGDAGSWNYTGTQTTSSAFTGIQRTLDGNGFWVIAGDGTIFELGDAVAISVRCR